MPGSTSLRGVIGRGKLVDAEHIAIATINRVDVLVSWNFRHIEKVKKAKRESKYIEFKEKFDINSSQDWCEIIKDIVAIANSGGGAIIFVNNHGKASEYDVSSILDLDPAKITDKIAKYTNQQFSEFEIEEFKRDGKKIAVLIFFWRFFANDFY